MELRVVWVVLALWIAGIAGAGPARATAYVWSFDISEDQVGNNPGLPDGSTDSPAVGQGFFRYDDGTDLLSWSISWSGLQGDLTALHVHGPADPGQSTPDHLIEIFNTPQDVIDAGLDPRDDVAGGVVPSFDDGLDCGKGGVPVGALACFFEERAYVNVHSQAFPMGEIRGDFVFVPELGATGSGAAALFALVAVAQARRRRVPRR